MFVDDFAATHMPHTLGVADAARHVVTLTHTLEDLPPLVPPSHPVTWTPTCDAATNPEDASTDPVSVTPIEHTAGAESHTRRSKATAGPDGGMNTVLLAGWRRPPVPHNNEIPPTCPVTRTPTEAAATNPVNAATYIVSVTPIEHAAGAASHT